MNNYTIKIASLNDFENCAKIIRQGFSSIARKFDLTTANCPSNDAFITTDELIKNKDMGNLMYALYDNHKMVGFMELEEKNEFNYERGKFTVLYGARHLGYGKALLNFAKNKVKELGGEKLIISVIENNDILKDWYRANGFIHTDTKKVKHLPFSVDLMESNL